MPRYKLTLEYEGTHLVGWQRQDNGPSVQQYLEEAVQGFCGETVTAIAAGRTDAGVHALGQVAHIDLTREHATDTVRDAINQHLKPNPVAVLAAERVEDEFHARFSALGREYLYRLIDRRPPLVLDRDRVWRVPYPLDAAAMHDAAQRLVGHHDFTSFRAAECQSASPVKTLDVLDVARVGPEVHVVAKARSFLHHQVRNLVGTLVQVGRGKWTPDDVQAALEARDRSAAGPTAPACGLYFTRVNYP